MSTEASLSVIDAKSVVDLLKPVNDGITYSHPYNALINDCKSLIQTFEETRLQHAYRESNFCADLLANEGIKLLVFFLFLYLLRILL